MPIDLTELEAWFTERPKWLQDAARRLVLNGDLTEQDFTELLAICFSEATGQNAVFAGLATGSLAVQDTTTELQLSSVSDLNDFRSKKPSPVDTRYKPTPAGFEHDEIRSRSKA